MLKFKARKHGIPLSILASVNLCQIVVDLFKRKKNRLKIEHFYTNLGPKLGMSSFQGLFQEYFDILQIERVPQIC